MGNDTYYMIFTKEDRDKMWEIVKSEYNKKECMGEGLDLLEKLLRCNLDWDTDIKQRISEAGDKSGPPDFSVVLQVMRKLANLPGIELVNFNGDKEDGFHEFYTKLGIYAPMNSVYQKIINNNKKELWQSVANWIPNNKVKWNAYCKNPEQEPIDGISQGMMFLSAWRLRNPEAHANKLGKNDKKLALQSFFIVLIELCLKFREQIENQYLNELNNMFHPFVCDCKKQLKEEMQVNGRSDFFAQNYTELLWGMEENAGLCWNDKNVIMYIGEAGAGKTTQMEKLYWDEINAEKENRLPIWIQVQNLKKDLLEEIKDRLQNHRGFCAELLKEGLITLYLDGLNELLVDDRGESVKNLVLVIKKLINSNPKLRVCMTDRTSNRIYQLVKDEKVVVFKCRSMNPVLVEKYSKNQWGEAVAESITKAVDPKEESNKWFWADEEFLVVPEKVNGLKAMIDKKMPPKSKQEYYYFYFKHILKREEDKKGDKRVDRLVDLLQSLAKSMEYAGDAKEEREIIKMFKKSLGNYEVAYEYFRLACQIPVMVECEEEKYKFTYCSYFEYLANDKNQDKSSATDSIEVQTGRKQGLLGLIQRMKRSVSNRMK